MTRESLLQVSRMSLHTAAGRPLIRDLDLSMERERIAVVGRNGVGKSTLLEVLAGTEVPLHGSVRCSGRRLLVRQQLESDPDLFSNGSPGETRRVRLEAARDERPDLLLLDEPTLDLDADSVDWLLRWLGEWDQGLLVVSHHRRLLRSFRNFFIVAESGCRSFEGSFDGLIEDLESERHRAQQTYVRHLQRLTATEKRNEAVANRRQRKKNLGRAREAKRGVSRILLNTNRSYAQESQGKRFALQKERIGAAREWAKATRRALSVDLPLRVKIPELPEPSGEPIIRLEDVGWTTQGRCLFDGIQLSLSSRDRLGVTGPNGAGKTTLLEIMARDREPTTGRARADRGRMGVIGQNAADWRSADSLLLHLSVGAGEPDLDEVAELLMAHRFPFSLAERPMKSLSPGERVRAAVMCLFQRRPVVEFLVLDEPTDHLDFVGLEALRAALREWQGGLCVVSHDEEFLSSIGVERTLSLPPPAGDRLN